MARDLTGAMVSAITAQVLHPIFFFEGEFGTGGGSFVRVWTGVGSISWNGESWIGIGYLGNISGIEESDDLRANSVTVQLSGIPSSLVSTALGQTRQGLPGRIWIGAIDPETLVITADPFKAFEGRLDVPEIEDLGELSTIRISYESRAIEMDSASNQRFTDENQKKFFPSDLGFEYVPQVQEWNGKWGRI